MTQPATRPPSSKDPALCTIPNCSNQRAKAGYGRLRSVCEKHRHERTGMDYQRGKKIARTKLHQMREDLQNLSKIAESQGWSAVVSAVDTLLKERYKL